MNFLKKRYLERKKALSYVLPPDLALKVENINCHYGNDWIIKNFNFSFKKNKIYVFLGKSGSGKSTLAAHFNGLIKSNTANIYILNNQNIYKFKKKISNFREIRRTVGMVLQNPEYQLFKETVLSDVCCGLKMLEVKTDKTPEEIGKAKLLDLGISEEFFNKSPFLLSGGQKKKIALAGILAIDPDIVIFDEPILGLDPTSSSHLVDIILNLKKQKKTVIVISNNIDLLLEVGDEMLVLDEGQLVTSGRPYEIFRNPKINLGTPMVVKFIDQLTKENKDFEEIWKYEPKNFEELSRAIAYVLRK